MDQKQQIAARLKEANNILVTVSNNPSVDQLASCIGLTLALNKLGKHATAVFSGNVPSTIEFLQPEKTLEKDTNSLRDFIIALDKSKADKLRYKVEDKVVKIFITPYRTSISEKDLDFSQGDFNVDVVIALGVHEQTELDQAITAHGRILHDATVATINLKPGGELGTMNWLEPSASSLSELVTELLDAVDKNLMDAQMATALLTGIVAETNRFSNEKTSPMTMSISAELMGAGANQQLVATKLEEPLVAPVATAKPADSAVDEVTKAEDGTLEIAHADKPATNENENQNQEQSQPEPPADDKSADDSNTAQIHIDEQGSLRNIEEMPSVEPDKGNTDPTHHMEGSRMILQPPVMGGQMSASGMGEGGMNDDGFSSSDPLALPQPASPMGMGGGMPSFIPPASAATAANPLPFMPASMTPGGGLTQPAPTPPPALNDAPLPPPSTPAPEPMAPPMPPAPAAPVPPAPAIPPAPEPTPPAAPPSMPEPTTPPLAPSPTQTLAEIEEDVHSPHLLTGAPSAPTPPPAPLPEPPAQPVATPAPAAPAAPEPPAPTVPVEPAVKPESEQQAEDLASARDAVMQAIAGQSSAPSNLEPIAALNAQPLGAPLHEEPIANPGPLPPSPPPPPMAETSTPHVDASGMMTGPTSVIKPSAPGVPPMNDTMPPPPVPPPMMPPQV